MGRVRKILLILNSRFAIITKNRFYYWYQIQDYEENRVPLGIFDLKNLYFAEIMTDYSIGGRANLFHISIASWIKKSEIKGPRSYYFSVPKKSELYSWVIYLNFLRVKNIYDSFTVQFGPINLPLDYEVKASTKNRKMKNKFKQNPQIISTSSNSNKNQYQQFVKLRQCGKDREQKLETLKNKEISNLKQRGTIYKRGTLIVGVDDQNVRIPF